MVPQKNMDEPKRPDDVLGGLDVLPRGQRHAVWVVVAEHDPVGAALQGCRHHVFDGKAHPVAGAVLEPERRPDPAAAVQRQQKGALLHGPGKQAHQVFRQLFRRLQAAVSAGAALGIVSADIGHQMQHPGRGRANALHRHQVFLRGIQHPGKITEAVDELVGHLVRVLPRVGDVQQAFQRLMRFQAGKAVLRHPAAHPPAVPGMDL